MNLYITIDVGGTSLKHAVMTEDAKIYGNSLRTTPIRSNGSRREILETFERVLKKSMEIVNENDLMGIGFGFPGPFDFRNGISYMKHKYQGIYGVDLRKEFSRMIGESSKTPIIFEEDSVVFLVGESWLGNARGFRRIMGITIGEGLGSAFMIDGKIVKDHPSIPAEGELWCIPCEGVSWRTSFRRGD
ncbi:MAG: ROK family protein [Thermotogae bacterium]|nr:ROK family protein [Thermotogota bacterium]